VVVFIFVFVFLVVVVVVALPLDASRTVEGFFVPIAIDSRARALHRALPSSRAGRPERDEK
jgi:hypothetical protein